MRNFQKTKMVISGILILLGQAVMAGPNEDLVTACKMGDLTGATKALAEGADVNFLDANGNPPIASAYFWPEITQLLLDKGADPNKGNYPALMGACGVYSVEVAQKLLNAGADPNKPGLIDPGVTFRTLIANEKEKGKKANAAIIKAYESALATMKPSEMELVQVIVTGTNCVPCLKMALEKGANINFKSGDNALNVFLTFSMSKQERKENCNTGAPNLEAFGLKVPEWYRNLPDDRNGTAAEMLELLIKAGADVNKPGLSGLTPLVVGLKGSTSSASRKTSKLEVTTMLLQNGADPKITATQKLGKFDVKYYPICLAAEFGDKSIVASMLEKGANINSTTETNSLGAYNGTWGGDGYTPLIIAILSGNFEIAEFLLDKGADLTIGSSGFALLDIANSDNKATISTTNKTPVYWAIDKGNIELIRKISDKMNWNFNPDFSFKAYAGDLVMQTGWGPLKLKGKNNLSPAMYADIVGNKEAKKYLQK